MNLAQKQKPRSYRIYGELFRLKTGEKFPISKSRGFRAAYFGLNHIHADRRFSVDAAGAKTRGSVGRNADFKRNLAAVAFPRAGDLAVEAVVSKRSERYAAADAGRYLKSVLAGDIDAAHTGEYPFAYGALRVVVKRGYAAVLGFRPLPRFPNGGRAHFGHKQPPWHLFVFKQTVSVFG